MQTRFIASINDISAVEWNRLCGAHYPFLRHEFLVALENSGSVGRGAGWQPHHLLLEDGGDLIGVMPLFLKMHSHGEYVFDWVWAEAYHRHGINYYPKLLNAIPFTPVSGPRWAISTLVDQAMALKKMHCSIVNVIDEMKLSSAHILFPDNDATKQLNELGWLQRAGCQFRWRNNGYRDFSDYLESFISRKRKMVKKERAKVCSQGIEMIVKEGADITAEDWRKFYDFYQITYLKYNGRLGYLNKDAFTRLANTMEEYMILVQAVKGKDIVANALFFHSDDALYGRYWGCQQSFTCLHFETCYYSGIEHAIRKGLTFFDPGAQGEHKIQRGFRPVPTYSNHWITNGQFRSAIEAFTTEEKRQINNYRQQAESLLPFKNGF